MGCDFLISHLGRETMACEFLPNRSNSLSNPVILLKFSKTTKNLTLPGIFCKRGQPKLAHAFLPSWFTVGGGLERRVIPSSRRSRRQPGCHEGE